MEELKYVSNTKLNHAKGIALFCLQNIVAHQISYSQNLQVLTGNSKMNFISSSTPQAWNMLTRQDLILNY